MSLALFKQQLEDIDSYADRLREGNAVGTRGVGRRFATVERQSIV